MVRQSWFRTTRGMLPSLVRRREVTLAGLVVGLLIPLATQLQANDVKVKMATIAPGSSPYVKYIEDMGTRLKESTEGRVSLVVYSGGQAGDEADIVRKMRIGQYDAAALTINGLYDIDEYFNVFQIPFFFESPEEMMEVISEVGPLLKRRLGDQGFVHLAWGYLGWVHIFTKKPVANVEDLKRQKIFAWAGNDNMVRWYRRNGFRPVALSFPDVIAGLQTGLIEAVPSPPLAAMQMTFFRQAPHMLDLGFAPMIGAMVISRGSWEKLGPEDQDSMLKGAAKVERTFLDQIPKLEQAAVRLMGAQGLVLGGVKDGDDTEWVKAAEAFAKDMGGGLVAAEIFEPAMRAREAFRSREQ